MTDQLAGRAADGGVDPTPVPTPGSRQAEARPSPESTPQINPGEPCPGDAVSRVGRSAVTRSEAVDTGGEGAATSRPVPTRNATTAPREGGQGRHAARPLPWHHRLVAALIDRAPAGAHGLTSTHVMVLALVALGAVAMAVWWVTGARPQAAPVANAASFEEPATAEQPEVEAPPTPTAEPLPSGSSGEPAPTASTSTTTAPAAPDGAAGQASEVVVDVAGKVRRPGIVVLPSGSRVADALEAAGGVRPGVDTAGLNLARPLLDGEQVLVGLTPVGSPDDQAPAATGPGIVATPTPGGPTALVNLNTATLEQLDTLPGVGPVTGQAILDWRAEHGAFTSVDELLEVDGIGDATLADLRDLVTV